MLKHGKELDDNLNHESFIILHCESSSLGKSLTIFNSHVLRCRKEVEANVVMLCHGSGTSLACKYCNTPHTNNADM